MEFTEIKVDGMSCGSCVASVTKALMRVPGVEDVKVDLGSGTARVGGEHVAHQMPALVTALAEAGYKAGPGIGGAPAQHRHVAGGCATVPGAASKGRGGCCCGG